MSTAVFSVRGFRKFDLLGPFLAVLLLHVMGNALAVPIDFVFSLKKPLTHGTVTLGGPLSPITFLFRVDSDATDLNGASTDALYPLEFGSVQLGPEISQSLAGIIAIQKSPLGAGLTATANGGDNGTTLNGRSLFVSLVHIFDFSGSMFSTTDLPLDDSFGASAGFGMFRLTFRPAISDPEYLLGEYISFDAFPITQDDFSVTRREIMVIPEPTTIALLISSFVILGALRFTSGDSKPLKASPNNTIEPTR